MPRPPPPPIRVQAFLSSPGTITIIANEENRRAKSAALRIGHDLNAYHRIDTTVLYSSEGTGELETQALSTGNLLYIGKPDDLFVMKTLSRNETPARLVGNGMISFEGNLVTGEGICRFLSSTWLYLLLRRPSALMFLHPHPEDASRLLMFMLAEDDDGLERILRLFPLRTGVPVPAWIVITKDSDQLGAAGILGAG